MVSSTSILALVAAVATTVEYVQAHGYIADPAPSWKKEETNDWVVEIEPQWKGGWDESKGDEGLLSTFKELSAANNYKDVRSMMDGNTVYGEDCGFTDPNGTPVAPPSNGAATFSRGIVHAGPCEIWLDDKMVLQNDDCQSAYGDGTQDTISVFKPVDYSSCASGGCMLRFYWLALQRLDGKTVWQAYKNCIPLSGPAGGGTEQQTPSSGESDNPTQQSPSSGESDSPSSETTPAPESPSSGESDTPSSETTPAPESPSSGESDTPSTETTPAPESQTTWTQAPAAETPEMTPAPSSKCNGRRRRRD
jgi:hypothetical protein